MSRTPIVAIPARFSASASAHRHRAVSNARALSEAVLVAGGEPVTIHPWAPGGVVSADDVARRLSFVDAVLLPGGGDLDPATYGQGIRSDDVYDVDAEQDAFDLAVARWAVESGTPLLAICRGWQVLNVALGGELEQHMAEPAPAPAPRGVGRRRHRARRRRRHHHRCVVLPPSAGAAGSVTGLVPVAHAADGTIEGAVLPGAKGWVLAVQWHPEDTYDTDPAQLAALPSPRRRRPLTSRPRWGARSYGSLRVRAVRRSRPA